MKKLTKSQIKQKIIEKTAIKEKVFDEILKGTRKNSAVRKNQSFEGWKKFHISQTGRIQIRCQANVGKNKKKPKQCMKVSILGNLICETHGGKSLLKKEKIAEIKQSLGIYSGSGIKALQQELKEIENLTDEQLQDTKDELKLGIALLRKYLKNTEDEKIAKNPGQLMWLIGEIARLKRENYEIRHSKDVSFTKEQVMFLFHQMYMILIELIKDTTLLESISKRIEEVGEQIGENGFKEIN